MANKKNIVYTIIAMILLVVLWIFINRTQEAVKIKLNNEKLETVEQQNVDRVSISIRKIIEEAKPQNKMKNIQPKKIQKVVKPSYYKYSNELAVKGLKLFDKKGEFPSYVADYKRFLGFKTYRKMMERLGGNFFIANTNTQEILYKIDFDNKKLIQPGSLDLYSPLSRTIRNETALKYYLYIAKGYDSSKKYFVVLLFPRRIDAFIREVLRQEIEKSGNSITDFSSFHGIYKLQNGLVLNIKKAKRKNGQNSSLNVIINL